MISSKNIVMYFFGFNPTIPQCSQSSNENVVYYVLNNVLRHLYIPPVIYNTRFLVQNSRKGLHEASSEVKKASSEINNACFKVHNVSLGGHNVILPDNNVKLSNHFVGSAVHNGRTTGNYVGSADHNDKLVYNYDISSVQNDISSENNIFLYSHCHIMTYNADDLRIINNVLLHLNARNSENKFHLDIKNVVTLFINY